MSRCPGCGGGDLEVFYRCEGVPIHSVSLVASRAEALAFPRGDIELMVCGGCGLVSNRAFDPNRLAYDESYEETQGYSERFRSFQRELAEDLVRRGDLQGKRLVEVGCGKGEFLALLCELGGNSGLGFDPAYIAERVQHPAMRVVPEFYRAGEPADFTFCKMTLEHVGAPARLLREIRVGAAQTPGGRLFVQVPDGERILGEGAFWDVYYEHCNYFTAASLGALLRSTGFEVERSWTGFEEQYLMLEAKASVSKIRLLPEDAGAGRPPTGLFAERAAARIRSWNTRLRACVERGQRVVIWGGGSKAVAFLSALDGSKAVEAVVDINPHRQGTYLPGVGHEIVAPERLLDRRPDLVIVMNPVYLREIRAWLDESRLRCEVAALAAADSTDD